jgi:hypothetical protein
VLERQLDAILADGMKRFRTVKPDWAPPYNALFKAARRTGVNITIDGWDRLTWRDKWLQLRADFEDYGEFLDQMPDEIVVTLGRRQVTLVWSGDFTWEVVDDRTKGVSDDSEQQTGRPKRCHQRLISPVSASGVSLRSKRSA